MDELTAIVSANPFTAVLGASGTGKSSVVKAGLPPHLRSSMECDWHILPIIRPGKSPLGALAKIVLPGENADGVAERVAQLWSDDDALA